MDVTDLRTDEGNVLLWKNFFERLGDGDGIQRVDAGGGWAEEGAMPGFFAAQHFGSIRDMETDFQNTLARCRTVEATLQSVWQGKKLLRLMGLLLKVIAPLM